MKMFASLVCFLFSMTAYAQSPTPYGHIWSTYTEDNLSLNEAVVGLYQKFDDKVSGDVSLSTDSVGRAGVNTASVRVSNLFTNDSLSVGLQSQAYVGLMEQTLGTKWLYPTFAQAAGVLPAKDAGAVYTLGLGPVAVTAEARNDVPNDKHQTYGLMLNASPQQWLQLVLAAEHNSLTKERTFDLAVVLKGYGAAYALEAAQQAPSEGKSLTSYGGTVTYARVTSDV